MSSQFIEMSLVCPHCNIKYKRTTVVHKNFLKPILLMVRCPKCERADVFEYKVIHDKVEIVTERSEQVLQLRERIGLPP